MNYDQQKHFFDAILCETSINPTPIKKGKIMEKLFYCMDKIDTYMRKPGEQNMSKESLPEENPGFLLRTPSKKTINVQLLVAAAIFVAVGLLIAVL